MRYILDANCFITQHRGGYNPLDVAISFWNKIQELSNKDAICSLDKVRDELYGNDDELKQWIKNNLPKTFFLPFASEPTLSMLTNVSSWANSHNEYNNSAKKKFLKADKADLYLTAFAASFPDRYTIVSFEKSNPKAIGEIKLPDACRQFNARCISLAEMFRELNQTY